MAASCVMLCGEDEILDINRNMEEKVIFIKCTFAADHSE